MVCQDCGEKIEYGRGWGGSVCVKCRAKRAHRSAQERARLAGKPMGGNRGRDPLDGTRRAW